MAFFRSKSRLQCAGVGRADPSSRCPSSPTLWLPRIVRLASERLSLSSLWVILVYCPFAHWIWNPQGFLAVWGVRSSCLLCRQIQPPREQADAVRCTGRFVLTVSMGGCFSDSPNCCSVTQSGPATSAKKVSIACCGRARTSCMTP